MKESGLQHAPFPNDTHPIMTTAVARSAAATGPLASSDVAVSLNMPPDVHSLGDLGGKIVEGDSKTDGEIEVEGHGTGTEGPAIQPGGVGLGIVDFASALAVGAEEINVVAAGGDEVESNTLKGVSEVSESEVTVIDATLTAAPISSSTPSTKIVSTVMPSSHGSSSSSTSSTSTPPMSGASLQPKTQPQPQPTPSPSLSSPPEPSSTLTASPDLFVHGSPKSVQSQGQGPSIPPSPLLIPNNDSTTNPTTPDSTPAPTSASSSPQLSSQPLSATPAPPSDLVPPARTVSLRVTTVKEHLKRASLISTPTSPITNCTATTTATTTTATSASHSTPSS
ncbi:hypothetical protein HK102_009175, partial [Quaeritorhiza haematococci]